MWKYFLLEDEYDESISGGSFNDKTFFDIWTLDLRGKPLFEYKPILSQVNVTQPPMWSSRPQKAKFRPKANSCGRLSYVKASSNLTLTRLWNLVTGSIPESLERGPVETDCWNRCDWGLKEFKWKGSFLGWIVGLLVPVQEILVLLW